MEYWLKLLEFEVLGLSLERNHHWRSAMFGRCCCQGLLQLLKSCSWTCCWCGGVAAEGNAAMCVYCCCWYGEGFSQLLLPYIQPCCCWYGEGFSQLLLLILVAAVLLCAALVQPVLLLLHGCAGGKGKTQKLLRVCCCYGFKLLLSFVQAASAERCYCRRAAADCRRAAAAESCPCGCCVMEASRACAGAWRDNSWDLGAIAGHSISYRLSGTRVAVWEFESLEFWTSSSACC